MNDTGMTVIKINSYNKQILIGIKENDCWEGYSKILEIMDEDEEES